MAHGVKERISGKAVMVYRNGILWHNPETGKREHLGVTREEAAASLEEILGQKAKKRMTKPADLDCMTDAVYRAHWRAYYYASARAKRAGTAMMGRGDFERIMQRAAGRCELTGIEFTINREFKGSKAMWGPSIDRKVSRLPYEFNNCRLVCTAVNLALNEFGLETLQRIAAALVK
jgi:hypothetical protein